MVTQRISVSFFNTGTTFSSLSLEEKMRDVNWFLIALSDQYNSIWMNEVHLGTSAV